MSRNEMRGRIVPHSPSTNFDRSQDSYPSAKRVKISESRSYSSHCSSDESNPETSSRDVREIPDSEAEEDDFVAEIAELRTELESVLPPIATDKEAIAEYEASRTAENE